MKKILFPFLALMLMITSCEKSEVVNVEEKNEPLELSGSFEMSELPKTIGFAGKVITFDFADSMVENVDFAKDNLPSEVISRSNELETFGPYYVSGTPWITSAKGQKILIANQPEISTGVYFVDVWMTSGSILLPADAWGGKIGMPNPSGYIDWTTQKKGVKWSLSKTAKGIEINWNFYTLVVKYDTAGAALGWTIPLDGAKVKVPYYYVK